MNFRTPLLACLSVVWSALFLACAGGGGGSTIIDSSPVPTLVITGQPVPAAVQAGQTATFTVTTSELGPLSYQWWQDGIAIVGAKASGYTTPPVTLVQSGSQFSVVITDAMGASLASLRATLTVTPASRSVQHYVDPVNGSDQGDGSSVNPWRSLQEVIDHRVETRTWEGPMPYTLGQQLVPVNPLAPVKAGDTIWLRSGYYGPLTIQSAYNVAPISIAAGPGQVPSFSSVLVRSSMHWLLRGLSVSPSFAPTYSNSTMVTIEKHDWRGPASDIVIEGFQIFSVPDETVWAAASDWNAQAANALLASGDRVTVRDCQIRNTNFGISMTGKGSRVEHNTVDGFCGDGLRGLGDDEVFEYNLIKNRRNVNDNHPDGFQSWSVGSDNKVGTGVVKNVVLRGNVFIAYEDASIPFAGTLQGIGCFDGTYEGWIVENNVVITDHWHGISFYGARNVRIVNNTVLDLNSVTPGPPWILVTDHKSGQRSRDCVIRNNLTTALNVSGDAHTSDHNLLLPANLVGYFVDPAHLNVHLATGSPAIDQGSSIQAPTMDVNEVPRPQGAGFDVGAHEFVP